jgi:hypothetical protein
MILNQNRVFSSDPILAVEPPVLKRIRSFLDLSEGWRLGEGVAPSTETVEQAIEIARLVYYQGHKSLSAHPGTGGQILLALNLRDDYVEILISPEGTISYSTDAEDYEDLSVQMIMTLLYLGLSKCISSEFSGSNLTTTWTHRPGPTKEIGSLQPLSLIHLGTAESPQSNWSVPWTQQEIYVSTSSDTIAA